MSGTLWVIRHAETTLNVAGRAIGPIDAPLTEQARAMAGPMAARLNALVVEPYDLWMSPARRCLATTEILRAAGLRAPRCERVDSRLNGVHSGDLNGLDTESIALRCGLTRAVVVADVTAWAFSGRGGETWDAFVSRCTACFADLVKSTASGDVLAVTHGFVARAFQSITRTGRLDRNAVASTRVDHGDLMAISSEDGKPRLRVHRDLEHAGISLL
jgi:broad specificity phosphatase PhoE